MSKSLTVLSRGLSLLIVLVGVTVLIGWYLNIPILKSILPNLVTMKANTALAFMLIGISLLCLPNVANNKFLRVLSIVSAATVLLLGLATLTEYITGQNFGIDQLLFVEDVGAVLTNAPGRMAVNTAANFSLLGLALLLLGARGQYWRGARVLAIVSGFVALLAAVGYVFGVSSFYQGYAKFTAMALHTAVTFLLITGNIFLVRFAADDVLISQEIGGVFFRRLILLILIAPLALGGLIQYGEKLGWYNSSFSASLLMTLLVVVLLVAVVRVARNINRRVLVERTQATTLQESENRYRVLYENSSDAILTLEPPDWHFTAGNPAAVKLFGAQDEKQLTAFKPYEVSPEKQPDGQPSATKALEMIERALRTGGVLFDWVHRKYQGKNFAATVLLSRVSWGGREFLQATVRDVSAQKAAEQSAVERAAEAERMNQLMVNRELKMVELKKEISALQQKVKQNL